MTPDRLDPPTESHPRLRNHLDDIAIIADAVERFYHDNPPAHHSLTGDIAEIRRRLRSYGETPSRMERQSAAPINEFHGVVDVWTQAGNAARRIADIKREIVASDSETQIPNVRHLQLGVESARVKALVTCHCDRCRPMA